MPNFDMAKQPRFPLKKVDTDEPLTEEQLLATKHEQWYHAMCSFSKWS